MLKGTVEVKLRAFFSQIYKHVEEVRRLVQQHTDTNANEEPEIELKSWLLIKNSFQRSKIQKHIKRRNYFPNILTLNIQPHFLFPQCYPSLKPNILQSDAHCTISSSRPNDKAFIHWTTTMDLAMVSQIQSLLKEAYIGQEATVI